MHTCDKKYIRQKSQNIKARITGHRNECRLLKRSCALLDHVINFNYYMNYEDTIIIDFFRNSGNL